jgi:hypothetical protein
MAWVSSPMSQAYTLEQTTCLFCAWPCWALCDSSNVHQVMLHDACVTAHIMTPPAQIPDMHLTWYGWMDGGREGWNRVRMAKHRERSTARGKGRPHAPAGMRAGTYAGTCAGVRVESFLGSGCTNHAATSAAAQHDHITSSPSPNGGAHGAFIVTVSMTTSAT